MECCGVFDGEIWVSKGTLRDTYFINLLLKFVIVSRIFPTGGWGEIPPHPYQSKFAHPPTWRNLPPVDSLHQIFILLPTKG